MDINVRRTNIDNEQEMLERSEYIDSDTINLSERNSIKKNKFLRGEKREEEEIIHNANLMVKWFILVLFILSLLVFWYKFATPDIVSWLEQITLEEREYYSNDEMDNFIEEVQEYVDTIPEELIVVPVETKKEQCDVLCKSANFIISQEGFSEKAYWDVVRYSIWYGTPANWRKTITKEVALQEVKDRIVESIGMIEWKIDDEGMIVALVSFKYNTGSFPSGYMWYIDNNYIVGLKNRMKEYVYSGDKYMQGLMNRRISETNLF